MANPINFSIEGLTVRGFHVHMRNWVPFKGQRLQCRITAGGPISAFRENGSVGNVPKEVSKVFRKWLIAGGVLDAVVNNNPKTHRIKGDEVPVIYLFTGEHKPLLLNTKNEIEREINKKMKRKKSLKFHHWDITGSVTRDITDSSVFADDEKDRQHMIFSVSGMGLRGFHVYKEVWVPTIGSRHECFESEQGAVAAKFGENEVCGHIPTDTQNLWKKFLKEGGNITAVVAGPPKRHRSKGEEVPVTYVFKGKRTNVLINSRNKIASDIMKKMKKKKSLCVKAGDVTYENLLTENASTSQQSDAESDAESCEGTQEENSESALSSLTENASTSQQSDAESDAESCEGTQRENSESALSSLLSFRKRGLDDDDTAEGKIKKMKLSSQLQGENPTRIKKYDIKLTEKDFNRMSQLIGSNWPLLGRELGMTQVEISHIEMDRNNGVADTICKMLMRWSVSKPYQATLGHFMKAVKNCPQVGIDEPAFRKLIQTIVNSSS